MIKKDLDPLELWKSVVGIRVSKSLGNSRVDQAIASAEWSNLKQGDNESILQYKTATRPTAIFYKTGPGSVHLYVPILMYLQYFNFKKSR